MRGIFQRFMHAQATRSLDRLLPGGMVLFLTGCATVQITPERAAWSQSASGQTAEVSVTHYVYIAVADKWERQIVKFLAENHGKQTCRTKQNGQPAVCVLVYGPYFFSP